MKKLLNLLTMLVIATDGFGQQIYSPFLPGEKWMCIQGNNSSPTHQGNLQYAWDFSINALPGDIGRPVIASADGVIEDIRLDGTLGSTLTYGGRDPNCNGSGTGFGFTIQIRTDVGKYVRTAHHHYHNSTTPYIFVKKGERVKRGQVIGFTGNTGYSCGDHIHIHMQDNLNGPSVSAQFVDIGTNGNPTKNNEYTSANTYIFDEVLQQSGRFNLADFRWYNKAWRSPTMLEDYAIVYLAPVTGGLSNDYVIYDAMRGARSAVRIFGQMWLKWNSLNGPDSYLGAPNGQEYSKNGRTYQDFQGGYIIWNGSVATDYLYPSSYGPGAFDYTTQAAQQELLLKPLRSISSPTIGWSPNISYLFVEAYKRNGQSARVGYPTNVFNNQSVVAHVTPRFIPGSNPLDYYYVQYFSGGTLGECMIMYDPDNKGYPNQQGKNEAYLIKGEILRYYLNNNGITALNAPVSDEYPIGSLITRQDFQKGYLISNNGVVSQGLYSPGTAYLWINSNPAGASVLVDGSVPYTNAATPTNLIGINSGNHEVRIALTGGEQIKQVTTPADQITEVVVNLTGLVTIVTSPSGAQIYRDGVPWPAAGVLTPIFDYELEVGNYRFTIEKSGFGTTVVNFSIQPNQTTHLDVTLSPPSFPYTLEAENMGGGRPIPGGKEMTSQDWYLVSQVGFPQSGRIEIEVIARAQWQVNGQWPEIHPNLGGSAQKQPVNSTEYRSYFFTRDVYGADQQSVELNLDEVTRSTPDHSVYVDKMILRYAATPPPTAPSNLQALAAGTTNFVLNWMDNSNNETGFKIEYMFGNFQNFSELTRVGANVTSYTYTVPSPMDEIFLFRVRAYDGALVSDPSNEFTVKQLRRSDITNAVAVSSSQINLSWNDNTPLEDGFKIERKLASGIAWTEIGSVGANINSFQNTGLSAGTEYTYRIRAFANSGTATPHYSDYSGEVTAKTLSNPLGAPINLVALAVGTTVKLSWQDNASAEEGFKVEQKSSLTGSYSVIATVGANVTSHEATASYMNRSYFYRVRAYSGSSYSPYSNEFESKTMSAPSYFSAKVVSGTRIDLSWRDNTSLETGYKVERKTGDAGAWTEISSLNASATTFQDNTVNYGMTYYYRVRAFANSGKETPHYSAYSSETSATTPVMPPTGPANLKALANGNTVTLNWQDNSNNEDGFAIERKRGTTGSYSVVTTTGPNVTNYQDSGVSSNYTYYYRIRSYISFSYSPYSNEANAPIMSTPSSLRARVVSSTQINLSWYDRTSLENGYKIERKTGSNDTWLEIASLSANASSYQNTGLQPGTTYYYRIRAFANSTGTIPHYSNYSSETFGTTRSGLAKRSQPDGESELPTEYFLYQNFPNPFNPNTVIWFDLKEQTHVRLEIFNSLGMNVATLVNDDLEAGRYVMDWDAKRLTSGIYFYRLITPSYVATKKMMLMR